MTGPSADDSARGTPNPRAATASQTLGLGSRLSGVAGIRASQGAAATISLRPGHAPVAASGETGNVGVGSHPASSSEATLAATGAPAMRGDAATSRTSASTTLAKHGVTRRLAVSFSGLPSPRPEEAELVVEDRLGGGGMGEVFRAMQRSLMREVAVKVLRHGADEAATRRFESEAKIGARLDHPNILPVHELGLDRAGQPIYVMKLVRGRSWSDRLAAIDPDADPIDARRPHLEILLAVTDALGFAHANHVVHRDVKPDNVMVGDHGEVLVADWGIAAFVGEKPPADGILRVEDSDVLCGTPMYVAPETTLDDPRLVGPAADVYALGCILFEIVYGRPLRAVDSALEALELATRNAWAFPSEIPTRLKPLHVAFAPLIEHALRTDPKARPKDADTFGRALRLALRTLDSIVQTTRGLELLAHAQRLVQGTRPRGDFTHHEGLMRAIASFETALVSWPSNADARHELARTHLLFARTLAEDGLVAPARAHVTELDELPGTSDLPATIAEERAETVQRIDDAEQALASAARRVSRLRLATAASLLAIFVVVLIASALVSRAQRRTVAERDHLSRLLLDRTASAVDEELQSVFGPVVSLVAVLTSSARRGELTDLADTSRLDAHLLPLLQADPLLVAVRRADAKGNEYVLTRESSGHQSRLTLAGQPSVRTRFDAKGTVLESTTEASVVARERPWLEGIGNPRSKLAPVGPMLLHWTDPYRLEGSELVGITVTTAVVVPETTLYLGFDLAIGPLSETTGALSTGKHGLVFVVDDDGRTLALPHHAGFGDAAARERALLTPVQDLGIPEAAAAWNAWSTAGKPDGKPFRYQHDGAPWWAELRGVQMGQVGLWIVVALPERGFVLQE